MNVPLMWGAAGTDPSTPVLDWLVEVLGEIPDPVEVHGGFIAPSAAVQVGWASLRQAMRSWGISRAEDLTIWLRTNGLPATQRGNHLSARAQEHIMTEACRADARVALLETAFVALALFRGRQMGLPPMTPERVLVPRPSRRSLFVHDGGVPPESWESLDGVDLADTFLQRVPMLLSSFPSRSALILFFFGSPRTNKSQTGRRRESRNSSVETVRTDPNDVVAQTTREWFCWTGSVGTPRRPVCARGLGQSVACCTTKFVQQDPTQRVE